MHLAFSTRKLTASPVGTAVPTPPSAEVKQKGSSFNKDLNFLGRRKKRSAGGLTGLNSSMPLQLGVALDVRGWGPWTPKLGLGLGPVPAG